MILCNDARIGRAQTKLLLRTMKLTAIILFSACIAASAKGFSQKITLNVKNAPLEKVFQEIKKQSGYSIFYNYRLLEDIKPVTITVKDVSVADALKECLKSEPLDFEIADKSIVIKEKNVSSSSVNARDGNEAIPPPIDVHGKVVNENGEPVAGASVIVKGDKTKGTTTDADGNFSLSGVDENAMLVISGTNIEQFEIKVSGKKELGTLSAKSRVSTLDELHVIAYGTNTQRYNIGSIYKVTSEEIASQPVGNLLAALEGRVPGLVISQTSGIPGSTIKVQLRGQNSINPVGGNSLQPLDNPLFIIDGVPFAPNNANINLLSSVAAPSTTNSLYQNQYGGLSPFSSINPSDLESVEFLSDADATAIYGSRGANGVVLITTKKGKAGKTKFSTSISTGQSQATHLMKMLNTQQYLAVRREALRYDNLFATNSNSPDILIYDSTQSINWADHFFGGTAHTLDINSNISGGNVNTQFLAGAGYHRESYIFPGDFSEYRISFNLNMHHNSNDGKLQIDISANYGYDNNNSSGSNLGLKAFTLAPNYPSLLDSNSSLNWYYKGYNLQTNPLQYLKQSYLAQTYNLISSCNVSYQMMKGLTIRSSFGYNSLASNELSKVPIYAQNPANNRSGSAAFGDNDLKTWIVEPQAEYKKKIGKGNFAVLAGATFQKNTNVFSQISGSGYINDALLNIVSAASVVSTIDGGSIYKYSAIFGRINYIWSKKYIFNLTGRRDGSSRFGPGKQFGNFGSAGAGWIFSEEDFVKRALHFLDYGKIKISYGTTGNDRIADYQYLPNWATISDLYQNIRGYIPQNLFQPDFSWAVTKKLEVGLELGVLKDRVLFSSTWYRNRCGNQLVNYNLPIQTGFNNVTKNFPATVQNSGWEFQLNSTNIQSKKITWSSGLIISINRNKLISFPGIETSSYSSIYTVGQPLSVVRAYQYAGVNTATGLFQFVAKSGGVTSAPILTQDKSVIGDLDPKYTGSIRNTISYKGIQLDLFLEFRKQLGVNYFKTVYSNPVGGQVANIPADLLSYTRWTKAGDYAQLQYFSTTTSGASTIARNALIASDFVYSTASFLRFKTISLSYALNTPWLKKAKVEGCKVYLNAQNLFTISGFKGHDPETQSYYGVPPLKTIVCGLQFTL